MSENNVTHLAEQHYKRLLQDCSRAMLDRAHTEPLLNAFLQQFPQYAPALRLRGLMYNFALATEPGVAADDPRFHIIAESFERALQADPTHTLTLIDLGDYWQARGDLHTAIRYYERAIALLTSGHCVDDLEEERAAAQEGLAQAHATLHAVDDP